MKYLKKFNENFSSVNENSVEGQLSPEAKKAMQDVVDDLVKNLSDEELVKLQGELQGVTPEKVKAAVVKAEVDSKDSANGMNEGKIWDGIKKGFSKLGNRISKYSGSIGAIKFLGGLSLLGLKAELLSRVTNTLKFDQVMDVMNDPTLVVAGVTTLIGMIMLARAVKKGHDVARENAKIEWEKNMVRKGLAKKDEKGVLVSLKTGKPLVYAG